VTLAVRTTPEAEAQISEIDSWWRTNRPASPDLFLDELEVGFEILGHVPLVGRLYRRSPVKGTRRFLLRQTRYHVYYVAEASQVRVLAVWHARRGLGPPLRMQSLSRRSGTKSQSK